MDTLKLVFATHNPNKVVEIADMLEGIYHFENLTQVGIHEEIPEDQDTIEGNAVQKAMFVYEHYGLNCFAEDTGLIIDALDGRPGVYTARYAGDSKDPEANMNKVLAELDGQNVRSARFKTVIALVIDGKVSQFEGVCEGQIASAKKGQHGFGYDPIFIPEGFTQTFAELDKKTKATISHRGKAVERLVAYLKNLNSNQG